jgi:Fe/S biogenesis protein NfuA
MTETDQQTPAIHMTESAIEHFNYLIKKEEMPGLGLRLFVDHKGPMADVSIAFCPPGENRGGDIPMNFNGFTLFIEKASLPFLQGAEIDYKKDATSGSLAITAPNLRGGKPKDDAPLAERIEYILQSEVNPSLASHGGMVSLVEITAKMEVVLRFGGGCHGCGMVDVTLKEGIEKSLKTQLPEITAVIDVTDHSSGENPYYKHQCA